MNSLPYRSSAPDVAFPAPGRAGLRPATNLAQVPFARSATVKSGLPSIARRAEEGVALVMTLAILAIMLVLVVSFATLSRTEVGSSNNYRDYVASKYLAQGGLNRAMAEIAYTYSASSNSFNTGLGSIYSSVNTNGDTYAAIQVAGGAPAWYATDIERVVTNSRTGQVYAKRGADGAVDAVVLPNQLTNSTYTAQWLGMKDTNGVLVGRVAYIITAGGLNLNVMGNLLASTLPDGMKENARNEGQSVAELNLPAALMAMNPNATTGWSFANATNDLRQILLARYVDGYPGDPGDDDGNNTTFTSDGIDNNGDGRVDEPNEGFDEPQEVLSRSDGTVNTTLQPVGSAVGTKDTIITDLKQLHDGSIGNDAASQARFRNNFALVRRWFTTQSPLPVSPTLIPLNDTAVFPALTGRNAFFAALTNRFLQINFPTNNLVAQAQVAANIVNYAYPPADEVTAPNPAVYSVTVGNTNVYGVARVPYINQVELEVIVSANLQMPSSNVVLTLYYQPRVELWYPYTNSFPVSSVTISNAANVAGGLSLTSWTQPAQTMGSPASWTTCAFSAITNTSRFRVLAPVSGRTVNGTRTWPNVGLNPITVPVTVSNFSFSVKEEYPVTQIVDYTPTFRTNFALVFPTNVLMQVTNNAWAAKTVEFTNILSFAVNDPRVKQWFVEYAGLVTNNAIRTSLGGLNLTSNLTSDTCVPPITASGRIFAPDLGEDADFAGQAGPGIGPFTFWVKHRRPFSSIAELGRVHRGTPWRTIDFKGGGTDGNLLDYFTIVSNMWGGSSYTFAHGKVNINARSDATPIWAALFAGMPYQVTQNDGTKTTPVFFDYSTGSNPQIDSTFPESKEMGKIFGSRAGAITHLGALTSVTDLSNLASNHAAVFPTTAFPQMKTDEDKEYLLGRLINLVGTQGQGNTFTIYAWGQALRGAPSASYNTNRVVTAETLIVAMVRPEVDSAGHLMLKLIYYRYNPDLELSQGF